MSTEEQHKLYWRKNLRLLGILLSVWFLFSCVLSIFLVEPLNQFHIAGFPLGMWIAQQGSIVVFVILVLVYCLEMQKIDREFDVDEEAN